VKKLSLRSGLLATTTICGAALSTMVGGALVATVATMLPTVAQAQDYTSGALLGTVTDAGGAPVAGATVTLTSTAQGQARTLTTNASGQFTAVGLPAGEYSYAVSANGYDDATGTATVIISQEVRYDIAMQTTGAAQTVVVKGKRVRQDFTKTTTGLTVDLDTLTAQQPIARSLTAVTMLAPTVTKGDPGFGNVASFGGGSVAENAYYINGLNITNPDTYVGSAQVPFDFYKTIEVKTGGYQAEYGRATGGVVNAVTKSGSNQFTFGVHGNFAPDTLRNESLDTQTVKASRYKNSQNSLTVEAGGPIIKDHLFAYGLASFNDTQIETVSKTAGTYSKLKNDDPFYGIKLDGYINPTQHFEVTYFDTTNTDNVSKWDYNGGTDTIGDAIVGGGYKAQTGGVNWVAKYTGDVTDWFTVSGAYGISEDSDNQLADDTSGYYVRDYILASTGPRISKNQANSANYVTETKREFYRFDGDMRYEFLGRHKLRFGYDHEKNSELKTTLLAGGEPVQYQWRNISVASSTDTPQKLLRVIYENLGGKVSSENEAAYIQDSWDVTPTLNLQIGARVDNFKQFNLSGEQYLDLKNNFAPRLGFSWTPDVDGGWKVFGSYGSYYIPPAMNMGFRGKDLYFAEHFTAPTGGWVIDPDTGLPAAVGDAIAVPRLGYDSECPASTLANAPGFNSTNAASGVAACAVYGDGTQEKANAKAELNLKATREDEIVLGTNYRVDDLWTLGLTYTHRELKRVSEDSDFNDAIIAKLEGMGLDASNFYGGSSYYVWNVGDHSATVRLKELIPGETEQRVLTLTADELGHYHNPTRDYDAVVFDFKRAFDGKWGLQGSYTWSRSYGNYEGTVKSDVGNVTQDDAGATIAYDSPGFEDYGTGLLANDRTHTLKVWGSYAITPDFLVGANVLVQSPRHLSCLGVHPTDPYAASYGAYSHYCNGEPAPLGKGNKTDWTKQIDLSLRYTVPTQFSLGGSLVLRADIFNAFDQHAVLTRQVTYEVNAPGDLDPAYGEALAYSTPRYVRIGFDLTY